MPLLSLGEGSPPTRFTSLTIEFSNGDLGKRSSNSSPQQAPLNLQMFPVCEE